MSRVAWPPETGRHDITDAMGTVDWMRRISRATQTTSGYAVGKLIEPQSYRPGSDGRRPYHHNMWPKYERGCHRPSVSRIAAAEAIAPGSSQAFDDVLLAILRDIPRTQRQIAALRAQLPMEMQLLMSRWRERIRATSNGSHARFVTTLAKKGTLDALAAMALECCAAAIERDHNAVRLWQRAMYRTMLFVGPELLGRGYAVALFELLEVRLFSVVCQGAWRYWFPSWAYLRGVGIAFDILWNVRGQYYSSMSHSERVRHHFGIFDANKGWGLKFALDPPRDLVEGSAEPATLDQVDTANVTLRLFIWAWNMLRRGVMHLDFPPREVFTGVDLHAVNPNNDKLLERLFKKYGAQEED